MKMYKYKLLFLVIAFAGQACTAQKNLIQRIYESRTTKERLTYADSSGKTYDNFGSYNGITLRLFFKRAQWDNKQKHLILEGFSGDVMSAGDTLHSCCGKFFIAKPVKGFLTQIRNLGETNDSYFGDASKPDGYFLFDIKLQKDDRLYFCAFDGKALREYDIGKIFYK